MYNKSKKTKIYHNNLHNVLKIKRSLIVINAYHISTINQMMMVIETYY